MTGPHTLLALLGQQADVFARCYVQLVEALLRTGMVEADARDEARAAALMAVTIDIDEPHSGPACPMCGR